LIIGSPALSPIRRIGFAIAVFQKFHQWNIDPSHNRIADGYWHAEVRVLMKEFDFPDYETISKGCDNPITIRRIPTQGATDCQKET
jgi:hypothetical protein